jgi:copper oxidase (laccase) domain-containing protein
VSSELASTFADKTGVGVYEKNGGFYLDLPEVNKYFLKSSGVKDENIYDCGICTICNSENYFSHRVLGDGRGMIASAIELV